MILRCLFSITMASYLLCLSWFTTVSAQEESDPSPTSNPIGCTVCPNEFRVPLSDGTDIVMKPDWKTIDFERWVPQELRKTLRYQPIGSYEKLLDVFEYAYYIYPTNDAFRVIVNFQKSPITVNKFHLYEIIAMGTQYRTPEGIGVGSTLAQVGSVYPAGRWEFAPRDGIYLVPRQAPYAYLYVSPDHLPANFPTWVRQFPKAAQYSQICRLLYHQPISFLRWAPNAH